MTHFVLAVSKLNRMDFAAFGDVIETRGMAHYPINEGTSERFNDLAKIDVLEESGRPLLSIFKTQPRTLPIAIKSMERHPLSSQAFVPLGAPPFLIVVAAPSDRLTRETLRAFISDGSQGVNYHRGVWHHPLIALQRESEFLVIDRGGPRENCDVFDLEPGVVISELQAAAISPR